MIKKKNIWMIVTPFFLALLMAVFIAVFIRFLPPKLPLFYSLPWGEKQLVTNSQLLIIPAIIALIALINMIASWQLHPQQAFFRNVLLFSSLIISLILTITFLKIVSIFI